MKAWVLEDINQFVLKEDYPLPKIKDNEVLVKVSATGICGSDIQRVYVTGAHQMPLIIGHEFAGKVVSVGKEVDDKWLEKRVGIFPLLPCKKCPSCMKKQYETCQNYNYLGSRTHGGFAEYVAVPAWNLLELPNSVSDEQAAMLEPMAVAVHAMRRISLNQEDTIAICGLGTIGLLLLMFLLEAGYTNVLAIGIKEIQRKKALELGLNVENYCDAKTCDVHTWLLEKTGQQGCDVFFECVGKNETIAQAIDGVAMGGKICFVGNPYTDVTLDKQVYWKILRRQLMLTGTWNSTFLGETDPNCQQDDWHYVLDRLSALSIHPEILITEKYSIYSINQGFILMNTKEKDYIKLMMQLED